MRKGSKKYSDEALDAMWSDWHCEDPLLKKKFRELGSRDDRRKLLVIMDKLGIQEQANLSFKNTEQPVFYSNETAHLFATMQNQIVR